MRKPFSLYFTASLAFAAALFLCCSDISTLKFPTEEELREREGKLNSSSSAEDSRSSSDAGSSSSLDGGGSSSSDAGSSSSLNGGGRSSSDAGSSSSLDGGGRSSSDAGSSSSLDGGGSSSSAQSSSSARAECEGVAFNPNSKFCYEGKLYDKCAGMEYDPESQVCENNWVVDAKCGEEAYNPTAQFCQSPGIAKDLCGTLTYTATQFCQSPGVVKDLCGTATYTATQFCQNPPNVVKNLCGTLTYPATQFCQSLGVVKDLCGTATYTATQFCQSPGVVKDLCGVETYEESQFCANNTVHDKCGGEVFAPETEQCCGTVIFTPGTEQFCYGNSKIASFCGNRNEPYDPDRYECRPVTNLNGIYLKGGLVDSRDSKAYDAVLIGGQTWMAKNLNHKTEDGASRCFQTTPGSNVNDSDNAYCTTYGRLYNWSTAMADSESSDANPSGVQGVCPDGWHLPSEAEWNTLMIAINSTCTLAGCNGAGIKLKATSGWNTSDIYTAGTDDYGFAALPGGISSGDYYFAFLGVSGRLWSATAEASKVFGCNMEYNSAVAMCRQDLNKSDSFSVRCVKD